MKRDPANFKLYTDGVIFNFDNGYCVSIRWGKFNYADHIGNDAHFGGVASAMSAEVAVYDNTRDGGGVPYHHVDGYDYNNDDVLGHLSINQVLDIMNKVQALPSVLIKN